MKKIVEVYNKTSLILRIFIGLVIGALLGVFTPKATAISILGDIFVGALKAVAPILVFVLVISSLAKASSGIGKKFRTVIILYMLSTFLAAVVAVLASFAFPVTLKLTAAVEQTAPSGISEVLRSLLNNIVANPVSALMNANYIGILAWAVIFGLALKKYGADTTIRMLQDMSDAVSQAVKWIINLAPFGILGLVFTTVSTNGLSIFTDYGKLLLLLVGCMLAVALIVDPLIAWICLRQNPYPLVLRCFKESGLTAFFTRSSAANIPINMALCERLGLDKDVYSVSIPLGATINMDGAAITITVMTMAAANTMNIATDIPTAIILSLLSAIAACGASGVAGGSLLLIPMACSLFGISADVAMQVVGVGFIVGVVQDSFETAINSSGDVLFAATAEFRQWKKEGREVRF
ncbi:MAG: serine/threonine transporter SstT [Clostridium sp.]|nr:serine/threonine transporter SstT [Clostridium sp.]MCM1207364.1 serine/threonine transporter SstT [Ruminococcus sp.]